jgi:hypothetical protein
MESVFDRIDREFRGPKPVKLECEHCGQTDDVKVRSNMFRDAEAALCTRCWMKWC